MTQVVVSDFTFKYQHQETPVLNHINTTFASAALNLLVGPSGSGKTTLLKFIAGLYPQFSHNTATGSILFDHLAIDSLSEQQRCQQVAMVFQNPNQQFAMDTVQNELVFVLENLQTPPAQISQQLNAALSFCDITDLKKRELNTLSGGEKQRVALACIVAMNPAVIVLDEPFASIDPTSRQILIKQLKELQLNQQKTIILADHDLSDYENIVDNVHQLDSTTGKIQRLTPKASQELFATFNQQQHDLPAVSLPDTTQQPIVTLNDVYVGHPKRQLLHQDHFNFYPGKTTLITGHNGIGKSTLCNAITKLIKYQGEISYQQQNIQKLRNLKYAQQVKLLFQDAENQFLEITVQEELALAKKHRNNAFYDDQTIQQILTQLNLANHLNQVVYSLSEGQKKKLQIMIMLIMAPPVLLLDEPLKGLDLQSIKVVVHLLQTAKEQLNQTQLLISHQLVGLAPLVDYHVNFADQHLSYEGVSA